MSTSEFSDSSPRSAATARRINLFTMFRLGLVQMGLGMLSLLTLGVLNQVMISELRVPATIAGLTLAMYQFIAPARVWVGQLSDARPIAGYHRTPYIWTGLALQVICLFIGVQIVWQLGASTVNGWTIASTGWALLLGGMFANYGLCISVCATPFTALLVDVSDEDNRSKLVGIVWSMLMVGIVAGAIIGETMLTEMTPDLLEPKINQLFLVVSISVFVLGILATFGVEKTYSRFATRSIIDREDKITLGSALKIFTASRQTGLFFTFLLVMTIGLFLQQPVLEPYAREVFGLTIGESAGLNKYWGYGILVGIGITGFLIVPRLGKQKTAQLGCWFNAVCFCLIILAGFTGDRTLLKSAIVLFGLASGVLTNSAVSLMLDFTAAETAGTFVGAWGLAQALSQASATVAGGALLDLGRSLFTNTAAAFSVVFACQAIAMLLAVSVLQKVNVQEFRTRSSQAIAAVLERDLD